MHARNMPSWAEATAIQKVDAHTYTANLYDDWCIGSVPNGGYVTGLLLSVAAAHFSTTLQSRNQPHTIALHAEFLRRTQTGPATFKVSDVKLGRQTSIIHVQMLQDSREEIVAYITNSNIATETGVTFDTGYELHPKPPAVDLAQLEERGEDGTWFWKTNMPYPAFRKASNRVRFHFPVAGHAAKSIADEWLCFSDGSNFTNTAIGFVSDMFPQIVEEFREEGTEKRKTPFWYPTLLLNLDIKKALPPEGVKWLAIRVQVKRIKNGRLDLEVQVHDAEGDLVALSHHVSFVLDAGRNLAKRRGSDEAKL